MMAFEDFATLLRHVAQSRETVILKVLGREVAITPAENVTQQVQVTPPYIGPQRRTPKGKPTRGERKRRQRERAAARELVRQTRRERQAAAARVATAWDE